MAKKKKEIDNFDEVKDKVYDLAKKILDNVPQKLTILPLRDLVIYPNMIFPVLIGRASSLDALSESVNRDRYIFVVAQKNAGEEDPGFDDIYSYGTVAKVVQVVKLPNNLLKILIEGLYQAKIKKKIKNSAFLEAETIQVGEGFDSTDKEIQASVRHVSDLFHAYVKKEKNLPVDILMAFDTIEDPLQKLYYAAANVRTKLAQKQAILEKTHIKDQLFELSAILTHELDLLQIEDEIDNKVHETIQKNQKRFYIQEQIKALQKELGDDEESYGDLQPLKDELDKVGLPEHVKAKAYEELEKLRKTSSMSPEYSVNRNYLELIAALPWQNKTQDILDIEHVRKILDEDHYDLEKPKDRILEFIAILNLAGSLKRQILCFVGPPGVGKTSLAKSIARALDRKFIRFSLGGVRDEAEIRGHRRTYVGAMPGKIIQSMKKAGTINPVILLDEIDKMTMDFRGDPSAALLEVLDPEQNVNFNDHYLEVDYDLSNVLFITTANVKYDIPLPLLDRMEIIELTSYLENEKLEIAKRHIVPKVIKEFGMEKFKIDFQDDAILKLIREYTREAGVRNLEREIGSVLRKLAKELVINYDSTTPNERTTALKDDSNFYKSFKNKKIKIDASKVESYLKAPKYRDKKEELADKVGVVTGLAWTSVGGDILPVEVTIMPGAEKLTLTGKLGEVMKESAVASLSYIRSNHKSLGVPEDFNKKREIHIHVPEGAIPKDGPSAGITMTIALISAATGKKVKGDVAMTGEITLRGNVLPIGGLKEKLLAAKRMGIKKVLVPFENKRDVIDIDETVKSKLEIVFVKTISEALPHVFCEEKKSQAPIVKKKTN